MRVSEAVNNLWIDGLRLANPGLLYSNVPLLFGILTSHQLNSLRNMETSE